MVDSLKHRVLSKPDPEKNTREYICPPISATAARERPPGTAASIFV